MREGRGEKENKESIKREGGEGKWERGRRETEGGDRREREKTGEMEEIGREEMGERKRRIVLTGERERGRGLN